MRIFRRNKNTDDNTVAVNTIIHMPCGCHLGYVETDPPTPVVIPCAQFATTIAAYSAGWLNEVHR